MVLQAASEARVSLCVCMHACMPTCPRIQSKFCFYPSKTLDKQNKYLGNNSSILFENFSLDIQSNQQVKIPTGSHLFIIVLRILFARLSEVGLITICCLGV